MNLEIVVVGRVQGVGYRPFVRGVAAELGLSGLVRNCGGFVQIFVSGDKPVLQSFLQVLSSKCPSGAHITGIHIRKASEDGLTYTQGFFVGPSIEDSSFHPVPTADISICETCSAELRDKSNRRFGYPFISCASCGPRFSILNDLPYDREHTAMDPFSMCPACKEEYTGTGRRSHAQTISCHDCGPQLLLKTPEDTLQANQAFEEAVRLLKAGRVLAVKGIGGYQLVCLADHDEAVVSIRNFKHRDKKPLAVMVKDLSDIRAICEVSDKEASLLTSPARPIVLLTPLEDRFSKHIVGDSRLIGLFLPYTGLHLMLSEALGPLVVTSLNLSDAPIIFRDENVPLPSEEVPHAVLYHEREIVTALDDSVVRVIGDRTQFIRRSRGYVPAPVFLKDKSDAVILATGGDIKSTFCIMSGEHAYVSQYFGDLESYGVQKNFRAEYERMIRILGLEPEILVKDMHPDYHSGRMVALSADSEFEHEIILETRTEDENNPNRVFGSDEGFTDELYLMQDSRYPYQPSGFAASSGRDISGADSHHKDMTQDRPQDDSTGTSADVSIQVEVIDETITAGSPDLIPEKAENRQSADTDPVSQDNGDCKEIDADPSGLPDDEEAIIHDIEGQREENRNNTAADAGHGSDSDQDEERGSNSVQDAGRRANGDPGADILTASAAPEVPLVSQVLTVQHHHAHIASVMAEHQLPSCIGVAFDGTGYGTDGNIWGGEFLLVQGSSFVRETHLANVRIVGGDTAAKRPDTTAFCYLAATGEDILHEDSDILRAALRNKTLTVKTSSMGRLFDAVSCVLEFSEQNSFEGESAILLENAAAEALACEVAPFALHFAVARDKDEGMPDAAAIVRDVRYAYLVGIDRRALAYAFHEAVAEMTVKECDKIRAKTGENRVALAGGVFANAILTEMITKDLKANNYSVFMNEALPPNDGSISLGQAWIAALRRKGL